MAVGLFVVYLCLGAAMAADSKAAYYKMVACSGNNGAPPFSIDTNTRSPAQPNGIFHIWNWCTGTGGDPPGNNSYMRIQEGLDAGNAGHGAYGHFVFDVPSPYIHMATAGGYTRQPHQFNEGWRSRFWVASSSATAQILSQGAGLGLTTNFAPHLWPVGPLWNFSRFVFEMQCVRPAGCDRAGTNATDLNGLLFTLHDDVDSTVAFTGGGAMLSGQWVRGSHEVTFDVADLGSGLRSERMLIDGAERWRWDHGCDTSWSQNNGEWARSYSPCPTGGPWGRSVPLHTTTLADGQHSVRLCTADYGQHQGLHATKSETCVQREIRTDNTAPGAPSGLSVTSANPNRYVDRFGARFGLPPTGGGSPIAKVHYNVVNAAGDVVMAVKTISASNPSEVSGLQGPKAPGDYRLRLWLEDQAGNVGPASTVAIPRDTTPPAAPQILRVAGPSTERWVDAVELRWRNILDAGSPIVSARYRVVDAAGGVVASARSGEGENIEALDGVKTPARRGVYSVEVWLVDEEGNVGAAAAVPLPLDTQPPAAPQGLAVAAPGSPRAVERSDLHWQNILDAGSPIEQVSYRVLRADGSVAVATKSHSGPNIQEIQRIETPRDRGAGYVLQVWLTDAEGNVGAPVSAPLAYECVRSEVGGGTALSAGLGDAQARSALVRQGEGSTLGGTLRGPDGGLGNASVCVFSTIEAVPGQREFLGIAVTARDGSYRFPVGAGPSRSISVIYRGGQRQIGAQATLYSRVRPTLAVKRKVVRNGSLAQFYGQIPGPHNDRVVVVLQAKQGKGWRAFRRYRTRADGRFVMRYRFTKTTSPTKYVIRAQVRQTVGYPWEQGNSRSIVVRVIP